MARGKINIRAKVKARKFQDHLERLQNKDSWSLAKSTCTVCRLSPVGAPFYKTENMCICSGCALEIFKRHAERAPLGNWSSRDFIESFSPEADLVRRMTVLFRYAEAEARLGRTGPENLASIRRRLVDHLGYMDGHPLDSDVRHLAHTACLTVGKPLLPLLATLPKEAAPWQFVANQVLTAGAIDPDDPGVKSLLSAAVQHKSPSVRVYAARAIGLHDAPWARQILEKLETDSNPLVREAVAKIRAGHRARAGKMPMPPKKTAAALSPIEAAIDQSYSFNVLKILYTAYLSHFMDDRQFGAEGGFSVDKLRKHHLVKALGKTFSTRKGFDLLYEQMPQGVKTILRTLVWEGESQEIAAFENLDPPVIREGLPRGRKPEVEHFNHAYLILPLFEEYDWRSSWQNRCRVFFNLPDTLRDALKNHLTPPPEYHLEGQETIEETAFFFSDEGRIFTRIEVIGAYIRQGNLKYSKTGNKLLKTPLRQMVETCGIQEFYPDVDRDLDFLRSRLAAEFLASGSKTDLDIETPEDLKAAFDGFFQGKAFKSFILADLLPHLKGRGYIWHSLQTILTDEEKAVRRSLKSILQALPESRWTPVDALLKHCNCRDVDLDVIDRSDAGQYVYIQPPQNHGHEQKIYVTRSFYRPVVIEPLLKGSLFFFAAFGLVDIAYDPPRNDRLQQSGKDYLSIYDGLRYVRLTPLGAFVAGKSDAYAMEKTLETAQVSLDENRLLIHLHGRDPIKEMALSQIAERVAEHCYKASFHSFLKDCNTESDIRQRKALFTRHIEAKPAGIWKDFLDDVEGKVDPLIPVKGMAVFRLKENQELISLAARDPELKKYILKAEDYHILIPRKDLNKVRKRLEAFGYLIQDLK